MLGHGTESSEKVDAIFAALFEFSCQRVGKGVSKDSRNDFHKNKYASLKAVKDAIDPLIVELGLSYMQIPISEGSEVGVSTMLMHRESGQWIHFPPITASIAGGKNVPQEAGKAITYLRRYSLNAIFSLYDEDDDGNGSSLPNRNNAQQRPQGNQNNRGYNNPPSNQQRQQQAPMNNNNVPSNQQPNPGLAKQNKVLAAWVKLGGSEASFYSHLATEKSDGRGLNEIAHKLAQKAKEKGITL